MVGPLFNLYKHVIFKHFLKCVLSWNKNYFTCHKDFLKLLKSQATAIVINKTNKFIAASQLAAHKTFITKFLRGMLSRSFGSRWRRTRTGKGSWPSLALWTSRISTVSSTRKKWRTKGRISPNIESRSSHTQ